MFLGALRSMKIYFNKLFPLTSILSPGGEEVIFGSLSL
jgi:hypothetical protein